MWNEPFKKRSRAPGASRGADDLVFLQGIAESMPYTIRRMEKTVQAVYEDGVLRPLRAHPDRGQAGGYRHDLRRSDIPRDHSLVASTHEWVDAAGDSITLDEARSALATIRGSLSEAVIEERRDR